MSLAIVDFPEFFREIHGVDPFPWQTRLLSEVVEHGRWPSVLDLPTGSGKTAAMDIAIFHLALDANRGVDRVAPVRIAFVVDRRLVVDDAYSRARKLERALSARPGPATAAVASRLAELGSTERPLIAVRLRGGLPREGDWARTPAQPTILCSTVDQVGSRLLFRGYGVSDSMKPVHAGLIGSDCLILLDEAHVAEPFRQTLESVELYRSERWREAVHAGPWGVCQLTATPASSARDVFHLKDEDREHPILGPRLSAPKPGRLTLADRRGSKGTSDPDDDSGRHASRRIEALVEEVRAGLRHFAELNSGSVVPAIGVVVNRVPRARLVFEQIQREFAEEIASGRITEPILLIGPARPLDRDDLVEQLEPVRTRVWDPGEQRRLGKAMIIIATQSIEVGVDIDLDGLVTELAPIDSLRQRFGRVNRAGRDLQPYCAVVASKSDLAARYEDPVYGTALGPAWKALEAERSRQGGEFVDFGTSAWTLEIPPEALAERPRAPVLMPAHLDLLSQTAPVPWPDPEVALWLHGPSNRPDAVTVVWRADIENVPSDESARQLLSIVPPRTGEAIELPVWAVRRWLRNQSIRGFADISTSEPEPDGTVRGQRVFRWSGADDRSRWIDPGEIAPGDTIVVPAGFGGLDRYGWNPRSKANVVDLADRAALPFARRRYAVRVAPGLIGDLPPERLAAAIAASTSLRWTDLRRAVLDLPIPDALRASLERLSEARVDRVTARADLYGVDDAGRARGVVFVASAAFRRSISIRDGFPSSTEDDSEGSTPGFPVSLSAHQKAVAELVRTFAYRAGLPPERVADLEAAAALHDLGKADPRFQSWLRFGDPFGPDPDSSDEILAKSGRPAVAGSRTRSGLPDRWRHEARSVREAILRGVPDANDPELVLWLIGTHHGHGRPLFPHADEAEPPPSGPHRLSFDFGGSDWPSLFRTLKARYGVWELARMEAILRLADHRASEATDTGDDAA